MQAIFTDFACAERRHHIALKDMKDLYKNVIYNNNILIFYYQESISLNRTFNLSWAIIGVHR